MRLVLEQVARRVGGATHLHPMTLALQPGALNVLLGATLAGKTSLMRLMAGLDRPTSGRVLADGADVTGMPVRSRNVAMVYQQFINYPSMSVRDNIASPLKLQRRGDVEARVRRIAERLHIDHLLERLPAQLSGGQQQRVALARALAKEAPLTLLDEPLVNLDYKLREELRDELVGLFATGRSTVVYATTEPGEALLLGGHTAVVDAGELLQSGPTAEVFHRPASIRVARAFSDPPMNLLAGRRTARGIELAGGIVLPAAAAGSGSGAAPSLGSGPGGADGGPGAACSGPGGSDHGPGAVTVGVRAPRLRLGEPVAGEIGVPAVVTLAEISGSETYVHADTPVGPLVAQLTGVHRHALGERAMLRLDPRDAYLFDAAGRLASAPTTRR